MDASEIERERAAVLAAHERYLEVNSRFDDEGLGQVWDADPSNVFFNLSGHTYHGLDHWRKLWRYYRPRFEFRFPWRSWDHNVWIEGDVAWVTCQRMNQMRWTGEGEGPIQDVPTVSRSTEIYVKSDGEWRAVHVHYSPAAMTPRPGNV